MVVRDRGFQRRALARVGGPAVAEPNQREHDPAIASPVPGSASASHIAGDQTVIADRPRTLMSREVVELKHKLMTPSGLSRMPCSSCSPRRAFLSRGPTN
jgi:hypothetical protein